MTVFKQLDPTLAVITPLGKATARFVWIDGQAGLSWFCTQDETGEFWFWKNQDIRLEAYVSGDTYGNSPIQIGAEREHLLEPHRKRYRSAMERATIVPTSWDCSPGGVNRQDVDKP